MRIAINGMGRIGRGVLRALAERNTAIEVVAVNDKIEIDTLTYLIKHDSVYGDFPLKVDYTESEIIVGETKIPVFSEPSPRQLPWRELEVDLVLEATGVFTDATLARKHLEAGAGRVLITGPAKGEDRTVVFGINHEDLGVDERIISNASCTTNCLAPMAKVLHESFGIESGFMTTVHAYTQDQRLHDSDHKDFRRARAAALNLIPTTTGAAKAIGHVLPELQGKLDGGSLRVPVPVGSITDLTVVLRENTTVEEVNLTMSKYASGDLNGVLEYSDDELVSSDIIGRTSSCVFDSMQTRVINGNTVKVFGWYDNERGFSNRLVDVALYLSNKF